MPTLEPVPAKTWTEKVTVFYPEPQLSHLEYHLCFRTASGGNSLKSGIIENCGAQTADGMRDAVLRGCTQFVRDNFFLLEVATPMTYQDGAVGGGFCRLQLTRTLA